MEINRNYGLFSCVKCNCIDLSWQVVCLLKGYQIFLKMVSDFILPVMWAVLMGRHNCICNAIKQKSLVRKNSNFELSMLYFVRPRKKCCVAHINWPYSEIKMKNMVGKEPSFIHFRCFWDKWWKKHPNSVLLDIFTKYNLKNNKFWLTQHFRNSTWGQHNNFLQTTQHTIDNSKI